MNIEQRIKRLENLVGVREGSHVPGTQLFRMLKAGDGEGVGWTLALGGMARRMQFFTASTIEECLRDAERELGILKDVVIAEHNYPTCPGCKNEIEEEVCWCGNEIKKHSLHDGHNPVPMGCTCGYVCSGVDYAQGVMPKA